MLETKYHACACAQIDVEDLRASGRFSGYASVFETSDDNGDVVAPGAFSKSLARADRPVRMLWQHDPARPIGIWESLKEDAKGLYVEGKLILETRQGREAAELLAANALDGLSIGYRARASEKLEGGRRLTDLDLWEISLVTFPMHQAARAQPDTRIETPADALTPEAPMLDAVASLRAALAFS